MVEHCCQIEDRDERNRAARTLIKIMENMNPAIREETLGPACRIVRF